MRLLLILAVVVGACFTSSKFSPHHHSDNPFKTLYMHLMPVPLLVDNHAAHGAEEALLTVPLPASMELFDWRGPASQGDSHADSNGADTHGGEDHAAVGHAADDHAEVAHADDHHGHERGGVQLAVYNLQIFQIAAVLMALIFFAGVPSYLKSGKGDWASRVGSGFVMWIRDEMVVPVMGKDGAKKFLPYFLSVFFFIFFMNLLGLVPTSATATASIYVTAALALSTLLAMIICGMVVQGPIAYWKNLVPHVPGALWPLMFVVELVGLAVKPFALMIRLFANLSGGHMVVLSFMGLMFFFAESMGTTFGWIASPLSVGFAVFIMIIESFVAMLQAYIFTQLSIIFVHSAVHPEH